MQEKSSSVIKLIPHNHRRYNAIIKESIFSDNYAWNGCIYFYGKLAESVRCTNASAINLKECSKFVKAIPFVVEPTINYRDLKNQPNEIHIAHFLYINDILECKVLGINHNCIGYFWTIEDSTIKLGNHSGIYPKQMGLVTFANDEKFKERAMRRYIDRDSIL